MKLKQRVLITVLASSAVVFLFLSTIMLFYYSDSYDLSSLNQSVLRKGSPRRTVLEELERLRPFKRNANKRRKSNVTQTNSDHAAEVGLQENEYAHLLENSEILTKVPKQHNAASFITNSHEKEEKSVYFRECVEWEPIRDELDKREKFPDLIKVLPLVDQKSTLLWQKFPDRERFTIKKIHDIQLEKNLSRMEQFHIEISDIDLYSEDNPMIEELLKDMNKLPIVHVEEKEGGTQLKLLTTFFDGNQALLKPMRFDRSKETEPNHFYFVDYERHNSEIAAFHLDRILGFRRCPPVVGRLLNITSEIYPTSDDDLLKTFFISPAKNICFHGHCSYYCDTSHAICGHPDTVEGSLAAFLPPDQLSGRKSWRNPWKRSYHKRRRAQWETDQRYCEAVRQNQLYNNTKRLSDLIDASILDFLIGNMDRHHYETFKIFGNDSFILHLDHGRGFGKADQDEISILAPLYQCCFISVRTLQRLLQLQHGPRTLSTLMRCSLHKDPVNPILLNSHLQALDRRLQLILQILKECFDTHHPSNILYNDIES